MTTVIQAYIHTYVRSWFLYCRGKDQAGFDTIHLGLLPPQVRLPEELKSIGFYSGSIRLVCWHSQVELHSTKYGLPIPDQDNQKSEVLY